MSEGSSGPQRPKILIVEDDACIAEDILEHLVALGYSTIGPAGSAEEAIALANQQHPDLLLSDIRLGGEKDGIDAATQIRRDLGIPVVYLTSHADDRTLERAQITEPYGYLLKPFSEFELQTAVKLALLKANTRRSLEEAPPQKRTDALLEDIEEKPGAGVIESADMERIVQILRTVPYFQSLSQNVLEYVGRSSKIEQHVAGEFLIWEEDEDVWGLLVVSGRISMVKSSLSGREFIVELLPPGDPFGLAVALAWKPYPVTAKVQVPSEVLWVPRAKIQVLFEKYPNFSKSLSHDLFSRLRSAHSISRGLAHDRTDVRVATALLALLPRFAVTGSGCPENVIPMTRQELGECIGCATETVVRVTKAMERDGLVDLSKRSQIAVLSKERLQEIASF